jgi:5-methylcytosine-specific restriction enzyme A
MMRSVPEWIGRTPDSPIPPRVRLRIFERHGGRCHIAKRLIRAGEGWQCDHIVALINGGEHRESNLAPALIEPHKAKTAEDVAEKAVVYRKRAKHLGIRTKRRTIPGRKFDGTPIPSRWV